MSSHHGSLSKFFCYSSYLIAIFLNFTACAPLDQRYFDPQAGLPPHHSLKIKDTTNENIKKSFIEIIEGTSEETYAPAIESAAKIALKRKENILFIVESLSPAVATPEQQVAHLEALNKSLLVPIVRHLLAAGAQPIQIDMRSRIDPTLHHAIVRINVR